MSIDRSVKLWFKSDSLSETDDRFNKMLQSIQKHNKAKHNREVHLTIDAPNHNKTLGQQGDISVSDLLKYGPYQSDVYVNNIHIGELSVKLSYDDKYHVVFSDDVVLRRVDYGKVSDALNTFKDFVKVGMEVGNCRCYCCSYNDTGDYTEEYDHWDIKFGKPSLQQNFDKDFGMLVYELELASERPVGQDSSVFYDGTKYLGHEEKLVTEIFIRPEVFTCIKDGKGNFNGITVKGYPSPNGKLFDAKFSFIEKDGISADIIQEGKFAGWAVVNLKPGAIIAMVPQPGIMITASGRDFGKFIEQKNEEVKLKSLPNLRIKTAQEEKAVFDYLEKMASVESISLDSIGLMAQDMQDNLASGISIEDFVEKTRKSIIQTTEKDFQKVELKALDELVAGVKCAMDNVSVQGKPLYDQLTKSQKNLVGVVEKQTDILFDRAAVGDSSAAIKAMNQFVTDAKKLGFVYTKPNTKLKAKVVQSDKENSRE